MTLHIYHTQCREVFTFLITERGIKSNLLIVHERFGYLLRTGHKLIYLKTICTEELGR